MILWGSGRGSSLFLFLQGGGGSWDSPVAITRHFYGVGGGDMGGHLSEDPRPREGASKWES